MLHVIFLRRQWYAACQVQDLQIMLIHVQCKSLYKYSIRHRQWYVACLVNVISEYVIAGNKISEYVLAENKKAVVCCLWKHQVIGNDI